MLNEDLGEENEMAKGKKEKIAEMRRIRHFFSTDLTGKKYRSGWKKIRIRPLIEMANFKLEFVN